MNGRARGEQPGRAGSAVAALVDVLIEYVAPGDGTVWHATLVDVLGTLGHSPAAVRQAVSRTVREGGLTTARHGRHSQVRITPQLRETLLQGSVDLAPDAPGGPGDGSWDVVVVGPHADRRARDRSRSALLLAGWGRLGDGVWLAPRSRYLDLVLAALESEGAAVTALRSQIVHPDAAAVVAGAWDLDAVARHYDALLAGFADRTADGPAGCFAAWTALSRAWRDCALADPGLPEDALPADWPRERARELVLRCRSAWRPAAHGHFADRARRTGPGDG
ncbi:phenylacetic acid degradation operon negative regulatory protein PaaX [Pseudonocardia kongjuensis]|uniref:Phenylacetic acid degradation operon negative regulatory protein PaaX n=1 Tax=Pseudonocardia kongjuensis TaxID=102227 RepID=A0ABN1YG79_9PSEU